MKIKKIAKMGRGVFATKHYLPGDIIEACPVIVLSVADRKKIDQTKLYNYYFSWGTQLNKAAIALGYGSLYNHSYKPNARYIKMINKNCIQIAALQPIKPGDEIKVNYNGDPKNKNALWFPVIE